MKLLGYRAVACENVQVLVMTLLPVVCEPETGLCLSFADDTTPSGSGGYETDWLVKYPSVGDDTTPSGV